MLIEIIRIIALFSLGWVGGLLVYAAADILPRYRLWSVQKLVNNRGLIYLAGRDHLTILEWFFIRINTIPIILILLTYVFLVFWLYLYTSSFLNCILGYGLFVYFGITALIDIRYKLILHSTSLFGAVLGLITGIYLYGLDKTLLGGGLGLVIMLFIYIVGQRYVVIRSKISKTECNQSALGFGDVLLGGIIGLILGWPNIVTGLALSILLFGIIGLGLICIDIILQRQKQFLVLPFAPFLVISTIILMLIYNPQYFFSIF